MSEPLLVEILGNLIRPKPILLGGVLLLLGASDPLLKYAWLLLLMLQVTLLACLTHILGRALLFLVTLRDLRRLLRRYLRSEDMLVKQLLRFDLLLLLLLLLLDVIQKLSLVGTTRLLLLLLLLLVLLRLLKHRVIVIHRVVKPSLRCHVRMHHEAARRGRVISSLVHQRRGRMWPWVHLMPLRGSRWVLLRLIDVVHALLHDQLLL